MSLRDLNTHKAGDGFRLLDRILIFSQPQRIRALGNRNNALNIGEEGAGIEMTFPPSPRTVAFHECDRVLVLCQLVVDG